MILVPLLPQHDPLSSQRRDALEEARAEYQYDRSYEEILYCKDVPLRDKSDPSYWLGLGKMVLEVTLNRWASSTGEERRAALHERLAAEFDKPGLLGWKRVQEAIDALVPSGAATAAVHRFEDYDRAYDL